jgi:hypothetical protein
MAKVSFGFQEVLEEMWRQQLQLPLLLAMSFAVNV